MPISQLSIFCLIQGIINYIQINTYWCCIVRIGIFINVASNLLLLASKKCFLTSQVLVGAGMNCRVLNMEYKWGKKINVWSVPIKHIWHPWKYFEITARDGYLKHHYWKCSWKVTLVVPTTHISFPIFQISTSRCTW